MAKEKEQPKKTTERQAEIVVKDGRRFILTPKGTELPLIQLNGKDYLQVAHRLVWFREEHPDWQIITQPVDINTERKYAIFRSEIRRADGSPLASATKAESVQGFADYIEKAETGATGRALALCGFGTQFAPELDEGERLADAPIEAPRKPVVNPAAFTRSKGDIPTLLQKARNHDKQSCVTCGSSNLTIGLTKPDNLRNPSRPYWKCLSCPPEKSFSHWVEEKILDESREAVRANSSSSQMSF